MGYRTGAAREAARVSQITTDLPIQQQMRRFTVMLLVVVTAALMAGVAAQPRAAPPPEGRLADRPYLPPLPVACSTAVLMAAVTTLPMP